MCACFAEVVHCALAALADAWTHGTHTAALHDPQYMYQHTPVVAHHAD